MKMPCIVKVNLKEDIKEDVVVLNSKTGEKVGIISEMVRI